MTKFILHNSDGKVKEFKSNEIEKDDHEAVLEFLTNMCDYFKNEYDKKIKSIAIITTHDIDEDADELNFSLAGFNSSSDDLILLFEKVKMKLLMEEMIA